jgi:hypothetical protein
MATDKTRLKQALNDVDYPADKEQLVQHATDNGADTDTVKALRSIPPESYGTFAEVRAAVPITSGESDSEKAKQHRQNTKGGLSEKMVETPNNPIVEELGENRGS